MLRLKTDTGTRYMSDLHELVEEAAGPRAEPTQVVDLILDCAHRLLTPRAGYKTDQILDLFAKQLCKLIEAQALDVQTYILQPLLTSTQQAVATA